MHETEKGQQRRRHKKNEDLKGRGEGRLKYCNVDGDVPLCLRKTEEKSKYGGSSSNKKTTRKNESGSSTLSRMKDGSKSKMVSGSKYLCGDSTR